MSTSSKEATAVVDEHMATGDLEHLTPFWQERVRSALRDVFWEGYAFGLADELEPVLDAAS